MHTVLRGRCSSVDELILSSTPALRHPWLRSSHLPQSTHQTFTALAPLQRELLLFQKLHTLGLGAVKQIQHQCFQQKVPAQSTGSIQQVRHQTSVVHTPLLDP